MQLQLLLGLQFLLTFELFVVIRLTQARSCGSRDVNNVVTERSAVCVLVRKPSLHLQRLRGLR
jgi:hypothetical protein